MESMEKKLSLIILSLFILFSIPLYAQNTSTSPILRVRLWSFLENEPGLNSTSDENEEFYTYAVRMLKKTAPYVFEGMIFGYTFDYTPYDKTRGVKEYFEVDFPFHKEFQENNLEKKITYTDAKIEESIVYCWAEFPLEGDLQLRIERNNSVVLKKIKGRGNGKMRDEDKGIHDAFENAIKEAVRNYARSITKNKPKEISGRVVISKEPRVFIQHGEYVAELEFYLEDLKIIDYTSF